MNADFQVSKRKRNIYLRISAKICVLLVLFALLACQQVQKPELKGEGPLAVTVPRGTSAPEYHSPAERWRILHGQALNEGDFTQKECILCHNPQTGCNPCHQYLGVKRVSIREASLYWGNQGGKKE